MKGGLVPPFPCGSFLQTGGLSKAPCIKAISVKKKHTSLLVFSSVFGVVATVT
jgi:hypothetical protein